MKSVLAVGFVLIFSAAAVAQHREHDGGSNPAIGGALPIVSPFSGSLPFAQRLGATISGSSSFTGTASGFRRHRRRYAGYALIYPIFGPLGVAYEQPADVSAPPPEEAAEQPAATYQGPGQQTEPAEENAEVQSYAAPSAPRPEPPADQPLFFIALTDNSVYTAVAYWVENGTLNYITPQGRHNQVSVALIDRETTGRLNRGSKFQLHLPGA